MDEYILIVGGAGYIGSHINLELNRRGYKTLVFDNLSYGHKELIVCGDLVEGDLNNREDIKQVFQQYNITAVMHFAAFAYVGESVTDPAKYYMNNVANTMNLLSGMRDAGVDKFIFSSTCAVYGEPDEIPIKEDAQLAPINPYGRTKLMVEMMLEDFARAYDIRYVSLRYFNAAGADHEGRIGEWHEPETHLIPLVLDAAMDPTKEIKIFGTDYDTPDGTCIRDYIHVTDLADAHILALDYLCNGEISEIFNLGNGNGFSVRQVIDTAREVTGKEINALEVERRPGDPPVLVGDASKVMKTLGWNPRYPELSEIISTAWQWHVKNSKKLKG